MEIVELEGAGNIRDIGGTPLEGGLVVRRGLIYRGSALCKMTDRDRETLFGDRGVSCVVDLRTGWERALKPDPEVEGVENLHIPFYDKDIVGIEYVKPLPGTKMIGSDFACDPDDFYRSMANPLTSAQMGKVLDAVFSRAAAGRPVYLHCSGGKDRVGVATLLVLTVLGAPEDAILEDYLFTNVHRDKNSQPIYERFLRLAGDEERAREITAAHRALPGNIAAFREAVDEAYGSMGAFLSDKLGYGEERCRLLRAACAEPARDR